MRSSPLKINTMAASMYHKVGCGKVTWYIMRLGFEVLSSSMLAAKLN